MNNINTLFVKIKNFMHKINEYHISAYAAQTSFFIIVCLFPSIILLLTIIQYTPIHKQLLLDIFIAATPDKLAPLITEFISDIYTRPSTTLFSASAILTLWVCGKTFLGISQGLNTIYDSRTRHNYIIRRLFASLYTLLFIIILVSCMIFLIFGSILIAQLEVILPFFSAILTSLLSHKFLFVQCFLTLFFMLMYKYIPNRRPSFIKVLPGAVFAAAGWQFFSYIYSVYVDKSAGFDVMYGRLSVIVFAMLWLYFCITIFFYGAVLNVLFFNKSE